MKVILIVSSLFMAIFFNACSAKEFNERVDSITGDISKKIDSGTDHSERPE